MRSRLPRILVALVLCGAMLLPTFALAEAPSQPCDHPSKVPVTRISGYVYKYDDENVADPQTGHARYAEYWVYNQCTVCNLEMSGKPVDGLFYAGNAPHEFANGVCSLCGYTCQHAGTNTSMDHLASEYRDHGDDEFHTEIGTDQETTYCTACYTILAQGDPQPYSVEKAHYYEDGVCEQCGHVCAHSRTYQDYDILDETMVFTDNGSDDEHTVSCTRETIVHCYYCDKELSRASEPYTYLTDHEYVDGKCTECGHGCAHTDVRTETEVNYEIVPTCTDDAGDRFHTATFDAVQYAVCVHCHMKLSAETPVKVSYTVDHSYNSDGVCSECGHVSTCPHAGAEQKVYSWNGNERYIDTGDNRYHNYESAVSYRNWCPDCHQWIGDPTPGVKTTTSEHDYSLSGICGECGHVNTCPHANVNESYWYESYDDNWSEDYDDVTYRDTGSDNEHVAVHTERCRRICLDCGMILDGGSEFSLEESRPHTYGADGVCKQCGHKNACAHQRTHKDKRILTTTGYTPIDSLQHTRTGTAQTVLVCQDCGIDLQILSTEAYSEVENHDIIEGACYECGYLSTCRHPNLQKNAWQEIEWWDYATPINSRLHQAIGIGSYWDYCPDCGETFCVEGSGSKMTDVRSHHFDNNGLCLECGYRAACAHENLDGGVYTSTGRATYKDIGHRLMHQVTPVLSRMVSCLDCGKLMEDSVLSDDPILEGHDFNSEGVCEKCGYKNTCAHAKTATETYLYSTQKYIDTGSDSTHDVVGKGLTSIVYCTDCGAELSRTVQPTGRLSRSHVYHHGVCEDCGHVNQCKHANTQTRSYIVGTIKDTGDNATHLSSGYRFEQVVCKDCGETISSKLVDRNASEKVDHKYVDDLCIICGHVKTAENKSDPAATTPNVDNAGDEDKTSEEGDEEPGTPMVLVYEPVSENTEVNGVKVADHPAAVEALSTIGENLGGDDVTVEIPNIEKILTADEKAKFDKLTVRERLLVALSALGFHDMVKEAAAKDPSLLSEEALALVDGIAERLSGMTEEELSALADLLAKFFQKETLVIDGKEYTCFSVDLVIERDGKKSYERYTFRQEEDASWVLARIEVGEYKPADQV